MKGSRLKEREDAEPLRRRLIGKRLVSNDRNRTRWEEDPEWPSGRPRVYFCQLPGEGFDAQIVFDPQTESPLLNLPAEIRNHVLEYVVLPQKSGNQEERERMEEGLEPDWMGTSAIIFTCKQLYAEARMLAVMKHTVGLDSVPRKRRLLTEYSCVTADYVWDRANVEFDKSHVVRQVHYG